MGRGKKPRQRVMARPSLSDSAPPPAMIVFLEKRNPFALGGEIRYVRHLDGSYFGAHTEIFSNDTSSRVRSESSSWSNHSWIVISGLGIPKSSVFVLASEGASVKVSKRLSIPDAAWINKPVEKDDPELAVLNFHWPQRGPLDKFRCGGS